MTGFNYNKYKMLYLTKRNLTELELRKDIEEVKLFFEKVINLVFESTAAKAHTEYRVRDI